MRNLIIMGANNPEIIRLVDSINASDKEPKINILGFIDNDEKKHDTLFMGYPVIGYPAILKRDEHKDSYVINNITRDCETRKTTTEQILQYNQRFISLIHPSVNTDYVEIGKGVVIYEGCIISPRVKIMDHCAIMLGVKIAHDCIIKEFCFIAPGAILTGLVTIESESYIGAGTTIVPGVKIGRYVKIGAGSLIGGDIKDGMFVMGNPGRVISKKKPCS